MWQPLGGLSHEKRRTPPGTPKTIGVRELWRFLCLLQFPATGMFLYGPSSKCQRASSLFLHPSRWTMQTHSVCFWHTTYRSIGTHVHVSLRAGAFLHVRNNLRHATQDSLRRTIRKHLIPATRNYLNAGAWVAPTINCETNLGGPATRLSRANPASLA